MAELIPAPFPRLLRRMLREPEVQGSIFDLPARLTAPTSPGPPRHS